MQQASIDPRSKTSFLPFKGRIKVGMGIKKPLYKPILTPALSLKERVVACRSVNLKMRTQTPAVIRFF